MRLKSLALAAPLFLSLGLASPGHATTIVQNIPGLVQTMGDFTPFDINAQPFDPATGVLQSVSIELQGSYTPQVANDLGPFPATTDLTSRLFVFATNGGPTFNFPLGTQTGVAVVVAGPGSAGIATGAATPVDQIVNFSDLSAFQTGIPGLQLLVEYGFRTSDTIPGSGSDLTSFTGSAILTYTYEVPEPGTALTLGLGLAGLLLGRRRAVQQATQQAT